MGRAGEAWDHAATWAALPTSPPSPMRICWSPSIFPPIRSLAGAIGAADPIEGPMLADELRVEEGEREEREAADEGGEILCRRGNISLANHENSSAGKGEEGPRTDSRTREREPHVVGAIEVEV